MGNVFWVCSGQRPFGPMAFGLQPVSNNTLPSGWSMNTE